MRLVSRYHPALKFTCTEVPQGANRSELIDGMFGVLDRSTGVGLAAPQVGVTDRVIIIKYGSTHTAIINPVITKVKGKVVTSLGEGCLSFPGRRVDVKRSKRVTVEGFDAEWKPIKIDARNLLAFIVQHELDHLDGVTIV